MLSMMIWKEDDNKIMTIAFKKDDFRKAHASSILANPQDGAMKKTDNVS